MTRGLLETGSQIFGTVDIIVFIVSMAIGACMGIYFAFFAPKGSNVEADYLVGNRNMGISPIAMSLVARWLNITGKSNLQALN